MNKFILSRETVMLDACWKHSAKLVARTRRVHCMYSNGRIQTNAYMKKKI